MRISSDAAAAYQRSLEAVQQALDAAERQRRRHRLGLDEAAREAAAVIEPPAELGEAAREQAPEPPAELPAELPAEAGLMAGNWDTGPVVPNPGAGMWASGARVAAAEPDPAPATATDRHGAERDVYAGLGMTSRAELSAEDRVRWSGDLERPTTDRWRGSVR